MRKYKIFYSIKEGKKNQRSFHRWVKVCFAAIFTYITRRADLPEETFLHTAKMTAIKVALKEIHKINDKRWVIYTYFQSSMQPIEYNKKIIQYYSSRTLSTR